MLGMVAEMERKFIREQQQAGIEAAKAKASTRAANPPCRSRRCGRCVMPGTVRRLSPRRLGLATWACMVLFRTGIKWARQEQRDMDQVTATTFPPTDGGLT